MQSADSALVSTLFPLLANPFLAPFLLPKTPQPDLSQLRHAAASPHAAVADFSITTHPTAATTATLHETSHLVFLPCFTVDNYTAGFLVKQRFAHGAKISDVPFYVARMVQDFERGVFVSISEQGPMTEIAYLLQRETFREHVFSMVDTAAFRNAIAAGLQPDAVRRAVQTFFTCLEVNSIPECLAPAQGQGESDAEPLRETDKAVKSFMGRYHGIARLDFFSGGEKMGDVEYYCEGDASITEDLFCRERLTGLALAWAAGAKSISVPRLTMPEAGTCCGVAKLLTVTGDNASSIVCDMLPEIAWLDEEPVTEESGTGRSESRETDTAVPYSDSRTEGAPEEAEGPAATPQTTRLAARDYIPLAPAPVPDAVEDTPYIGMRERKLAERRARNRQSAQRSNERKKKALQKLKEDLEDATRMEDALRKQERELLEENVKLRMKAAPRGVG